MENGIPIRLLPTLPMLAESLEQENWNCEMVLAEKSQSYRGVRLYHRLQTLHKDVLYLLRPGETEFPVDEYSYLSAVSREGKANHLILPGYPDEEILDQLLEIFSQFQEWENAIDQLLYSNADLQTLAGLGAQILENPLCIHDDWFVMMAITPEFARIMEPEYLMSSTRGFVPRAVVEDFLYDSDYLETYAHHEAKRWKDPEKQIETMYVNLWDGPIYRGRLLVARQNREFLCRDYLLAEVLAQRTVFLLRHKGLEDGSMHRNMDEIVYALLKGQRTELSDLTQLMNMLHWQKEDRFLCLRIRYQQHGSGAPAEQILHSDLFRSFPGSYILLNSREQSVVVNLSHSGQTPAQIRHLLAPLCRDYCLYAGISSPVGGVRELTNAYYQAGAALEQVFHLHGEQWLLEFSECVMEHLLRNLPAPLTPGNLIAPALLELMEYDRVNGTPYYETLREYLLQERDIPRTAQALIIHRTTLLYRLKKIRGLISTNLDDHWQRMYLVLSLWLLERGMPLRAGNHRQNGGGGV